MPKKIPPPKDKTQAVLWANIEYECYIRGITLNKMLTIFGWSKGTYYHRKNNPGSILITELQKFCKYLKISIQSLFESHI